jgi:ribonuclease P protein component
MPGPRAQPAGRLRRRAEFLAAASGRRFHTERMTVQGRLRDDADGGDGLRLGFTVSKRVGHATERNRIRRRLRAAAQEAASAHAATPADVVVIARREALDADYRLLVDDIGRALRAVTRPRSARRHEPSSLASGDEGRESPHA